MILQNRPVSLILIFFLMATLIPPCPVQAAVIVEDGSMEEAILLMFAANVRLVNDENQLPGEVFAFSGRFSRPLVQTTRKKVNEQRLLAKYYLDLAKNLPADSNQSKILLSKAFAHNEMADILQRRRNRENNPFQKLGRAITRPFKFIAQEITKLVRQGFRLLEEVGPDIIYDMIESYVTTGTPINARVFFQKFKDVAMQRVRNSLTNKVAALAMGVSAPPPVSPRPQKTVTVSRLMQTMTIRAVKTAETGRTVTVEPEMAQTGDGPREYGTQTITAGLDDLIEGGVLATNYFTPLVPAGTKCAYHDFQGWEMEAVTVPLQIDLDKGTFTAKISGKATDYLEATAVTIPAWDFTASFSGEITDGTIVPNPELTGWDLEGTTQITITPSGKMRCMYYPPGFPDDPAEYVWLVPDRSLKVQHNFYGTIDQQKIKDGKAVVTPGGKISFDIGMQEAYEDAENFVYLHVVDMEVPPGFPVP